MEIGSEYDAHRLWNCKSRKRNQVENSAVAVQYGNQCTEGMDPCYGCDSLNVRAEQRMIGDWCWRGAWNAFHHRTTSHPLACSWVLSPAIRIRRSRSPDRHMSSHGLTGKLAEQLCQIAEESKLIEHHWVDYELDDWFALSVSAACTQTTIVCWLERLIGRAECGKWDDSLGSIGRYTGSLACQSKCPAFTTLDLKNNSKGRILLPKKTHSFDL